MTVTAEARRSVAGGSVDRKGAPLGDLFRDLLNEFAALARTEIRLAGAEAADKFNIAAVALGLVVLGAVLLIGALILFLQAAVAALVAGGMSVTTATVLVGGVALVAGLALAWLGFSRLKTERLKPHRTIGQLQRDVEAVKNEVSS